MIHTGTHKAEARLTLTSELAALTLVRPWIDVLALEHVIPASTVFAINLCLEEALSNVIRHGYSGEPGHHLTIDFASSAPGAVTFTVEDSAPPFEPAEPAHSIAPVSLEDLQPGGQGIRFLRRFSQSLRWEPLSHGNRLTIGFHFPASNLPHPVV
jgi:serine/threonine-protein kinase RsbW